MGCLKRSHVRFKQKVINHGRVHFSTYTFFSFPFRFAVLFPNLALSLLSVEALISDVTLRAVHFDFLIAEEARRLFHGKLFATQSSSSESGTPQKRFKKQKQLCQCVRNTDRISSE